MELDSEPTKETNTRWAAKIQRAEKVGILINSIQFYDDIFG